MDSLFRLDIKYLKGIGPARAQLLDKELGIKNYYDLLHHFPSHYIDRSRIYRIADINGEMPYVQLRGRFVSFAEQGEGAKRRLVALFSDGSGVIEIVWFNRIRQISEACSGLCRARVLYEVYEENVAGVEVALGEVSIVINYHVEVVARLFKK